MLARERYRNCGHAICDTNVHLLSNCTLSNYCPQMAFMLMERNSGNSTIDYPLEGSRGIVDALVRGIEKNGGRVLLRARVEDILVEGATALTAAKFDSSIANIPQGYIVSGQCGTEE